MCVPLIYSVLRLFILVSPKDNLNNFISATSSFSSIPLPCTPILSLLPLFSTSDASSALLSAVDLSLNAFCNPFTISLFYPGPLSSTWMYSVLLWLTFLLLLSRTYLHFSRLSFPCILVSLQITISSNMEVQGVRRGSGLTTDAILPPSLTPLLHLKHTSLLSDMT